MQNFTWPVRVYYEDTDSGGVVYYANYLKFMERARTEWLREKGYEQDVLAEEHGVVFAVRSVKVDYLAPALFNDKLEVTATIRKLGNASIYFAQQVMRPDNNNNDQSPELLADGEIAIVCVDIVTFKPTSIPKNLKKDLQSAS